MAPAAVRGSHTVEDCCAGKVRQRNHKDTHVNVVSLGRGWEAHSATVSSGGASRGAWWPHCRGVMGVASAPARSEGHARERRACGDDVSSGDALALAVGVAAVRHTARPRAVVAPVAVRGGHTAEKCAWQVRQRSHEGTRVSGVRVDSVSSGDARALAVGVAAVRYTAQP